MLKAEGVNVVRLNFSHGKAQDHIDRANLVRQAAAQCGFEVAIMADIPIIKSVLVNSKTARSIG